MASQGDLDAIVQQGGITVDQFPPLESDLNYIINDFLTVDYDLIQEAVIGIVSAATVDVPLSIDENVSFNVTHVGNIDPTASLTQTDTFNVTHAIATDLIVSVDYGTLFRTDNLGGAEVEVAVSQADTFNVTHILAADVSLSIDYGVTVDVISTVSVDVAIAIDESTPFDITHAGIIDPEVWLSEDGAFNIAHDGALSADIEFSQGSTFTIASLSAAELDLEINYGVVFDVAGQALVDPVMDLNLEAPFTIAHAAALDLPITIAVADEFSIIHQGEIFAIEPAYLSQNAVFTITSEITVRNPTYTRGNILNIPVWSWQPNWSSDVTETLQWLTDVLASPTGAEQRRALRVYPRRQFEFTAVAANRERSYLDQFLSTHSARDMYLPTWHEMHIVSDDAEGNFIPCETASQGEFREGDIVILLGDTAFDFELAEIATISGLGIATVLPLERKWSLDSRLLPLRKSRLTDQPTLSRVTDTIATSQVRFQVTETNNDILVGSSNGVLTTSFLPDNYRGFSVLASPPDQGGTLDFAFVRLLENADNQTGFPIQRDTAGIPFTSQKHAWTTYGRDENRALRSLLFNLRGRAAALWIPTFFSDFEVIADTDSGESFLTVENIQFGALGGAREGRRDLVIELYDGTRLYRRIVSNTVDGQDREVIGVDVSFPQGLNAADVLRVSFMQLSRLDQDIVDIIHKTDSAGASTCNLTFRSAPELRVPAGGF